MGKHRQTCAASADDSDVEIIAEIKSPATKPKAVATTPKRLGKNSPVRLPKSPSKIRRRLYGPPAAASDGPPPPQDRPAEGSDGPAVVTPHPLGTELSNRTEAPEARLTNGELVSDEAERRPRALPRLSSDVTAATASGADSSDVQEEFDEEDERLLSQEFSQEVPEALGLVSPQQHSIPYYLQNFLFILESVQGDPLNRPLINADDTDVICRFNGLPLPAQMLYVRLFQRKHGWLRSDRLRYAERRARALLGSCVRLAAGPRRVLLRVLSLFSVPLYEEDEDTSQQLLTLLMVNLGRMVYPAVTVRKSTAIFGTRDDLLRYETASRLERDVRAAMAAKQWEEAYQGYLASRDMCVELSHDAAIERFDAALPLFLRKFTAVSILMYVWTKGVELLQRRKDYEGAVRLLRALLAQRTYLPDYRGLWHDRLALNLQQHLRRPDEALAAVRAALDDPAVRVGRRLALEQRLVRLAPGVPAALQPADLPSVEVEARCLPRDVPGLKMVFLRPEGGGEASDVTVCSVEELALHHYASRGYDEGVHREAAPTTTLFALLFWDLLYEVDVADSFCSPYQSLPLDLNSPAFYERRRTGVETRLAELAAGSADDACDRLRAAWQAHEGCVSLAAWDVFRDCDHAEGLLRCLGVPLVCAICRRLATEYRFTRSGFPDLVLWSPANGTARIVEVKGPGDQLSTKQMLWLQYLLEHGAAAEVCYVRAVGARRAAGAKRKPTMSGGRADLVTPRVVL
ncbi:fanconi-associated nuclease 1-like [Pollicipes pollicipes]|uniref:fanconi-associated nuclease 1-like n=1 Tax=Pollicipes pollicipes TaxID=41117 RepID=UPI0018851374|nr:fanconi-associated nuclease 1-like [Pollicipes pollicipes]